MIIVHTHFKTNLIIHIIDVIITVVDVIFLVINIIWEFNEPLVRYLETALTNANEN